MLRQPHVAMHNIHIVCYVAIHTEAFILDRLDSLLAYYYFCKCAVFYMIYI